MSKLNDIPGWVQAGIAIAVFIATIIISYASVTSALAIEATERKLETQHLRQAVEEIKTLLREEMDRHHPRQP